jgi:hypothetical protein
MSHALDIVSKIKPVSQEKHKNILKNQAFPQRVSYLMWRNLKTQEVMV